MDYVIHNVSRGRHNRRQRAALPANPRMKQYVGAQQQRLVRGQPLIVSEEMVKRNLEELRAKHAAHMIELRTRDGRLVDLTTLEAAPAAPVEPKPHPQLDSVANDKNFAMPPGFKFVPPYVGDDATMPTIVPEGEKPALLQQSVEETPPPAPAEAAPPAPPAEEPAIVGTDAELEAKLAEAQAEAAEEPEAATPEGEGVSSGETQKKGRRSRR
jgi:hypothetical protein